MNESISFLVVGTHKKNLMRTNTELYYIYRLALGCIFIKQNHNTIILLVTEVKYATICVHGVGRQGAGRCSV